MSTGGGIVNHDTRIGPRRMRLPAKIGLGFLVGLVLVGHTALGQPSGIDAAGESGEPASVGSAALALSLPAGTTSVEWAAGATSAEAVVEDAGGALTAIYAWNESESRWLRYVAGAPGYVNTLTALEPGATYWFAAHAAFTIEFDL